MKPPTSGHNILCLFCLTRNTGNIQGLWRDSAGPLLAYQLATWRRFQNPPEVETPQPVVKADSYDVGTVMPNAVTALASANRFEDELTGLFSAPLAAMGDYYCMLAQRHRRHIVDDVVLAERSVL